jgi:hypothetical protein
MDFQEAMQNLKNRLHDARTKSLEGGFELSEAMLEQVAIEAERFRKECLRQADSLENQAKACRWQADAYSAVSAIVYRTFNGFVNAEEKRQAEELAQMAERKEKEEYARKVAAEEEARNLSKAESEPEASQKKRRGKPVE